MTVLVTGSSGRIGSSLTVRLAALGWQVRGFDREARPRRREQGPIEQMQVEQMQAEQMQVEEVQIDEVRGDITDPDALDRAMAGVQAVVHLAGQPTEAPWPVIREANIEGSYQVFEAARRAGVRRFVYASSNHAVGFTPRPESEPAELAAETPPRPDTLYGVSKVFGEALGRYYADRYGMQVACLRIGTFADTPPDARAMATWLSPRDCARLVDACLRTDRLDFALVWGVSANVERWWSLDAGQALGYLPLDDAGRHREGRQAEPDPQPFVGGGFTAPSFGIDEVRERAEGGTR